MIDVKDRVPTKPNRVKFNFDDGTVKYAIMERADEPVENGTPINKALFSRLQSDIGLVTSYNVPNIIKRSDNYNYLSLSNKSDEYTIGMRVLIKIEQQFEEFNESIIPTLTANGIENAVNGFYTGQYEAFDKNDSTYITKTMVFSKIICPMLIKPTEIKATIQGVGGTPRIFNVFGANDDDMTLGNSTGTTTNGTPLTTEVSFNDTNVHTHIFNIENSDYYKNFFIRQFPSGKNGNIYSMEITKGEIGKYNPSVNSYININDLGNKLISSPLEIGKKYELIYDGAMFNVREVA